MLNVSVEYDDDVKELIRKMKEKYGDIIIILGHGCCSPTEPQIYRSSDFIVGSDYVEVGRVEDVPFYIERNLAESYNGWVLTLRVEPLNGAVDDSFSLDVLEGVRLRLGFKKFRIAIPKELRMNEPPSS
ncbi:MAG: DUF779 domain-containing protein [Vulcanisaeta sp.]|nr:DUF779 domain-containing protein [Vulcanisaeta sp.]MCG2870047.1 DUF779 domain-containing protein [Vulcanisaeta sp.]MCG2887435.1 DUF779 domain-containing protein [Vulcanisaeta sp.]